MWFGRKKPSLTREEALSAIPVRNPGVFSSLDDSGHVLLTLERRKDWRTQFLSAIFQIPKKKTIELDERGSLVWNLCDGRNTVRQVIEGYRQRYVRDQRVWKEAELQVIEFLRMLSKKRLVAMAILKPTEQDAPGGQGDVTPARQANKAPTQSGEAKGKGRNAGK